MISNNGFVNGAGQGALSVGGVGAAAATEVIIASSFGGPAAIGAAVAIVSVGAGIGALVGGVAGSEVDYSPGMGSYDNHVLEDIRESGSVADDVSIY